jgi:hypothetical protein
VRDEHEIALECGCAGRCTQLVIRDWFVDDDDYPPWVEIWTRVNARSALSWRLKLAWKIVTRRDHYCDDLTLSPEAILRLRDFLNECVDLRGAEPAQQVSTAVEGFGETGQ